MRQMSGGSLQAGALLLLGLWLLLFHPALTGIVTEPRGRGGLALTALLGLALAALPGVGGRFKQAMLRPSTPVFVALVALLSGALSWWFASVMLGNKTLALDCGVYLLQARAMAHGGFGIPQEAPALFQSSRFLFEGPDGQLYGVFPPGYPLFLAPFAALGVPMLSGPVTAVATVVAQYWLARELGEDEWVARASLLLPLPCYARTIETADLLSHAFVGLLATVALAAALRCRSDLRARWGLLIGACVGWATSARLLDGLVLLAVLLVLAAWLAWRQPRLALLRVAAVAALAALPFVALLLAQQKASTGLWLQPTQSEFFRRSDHPPTCHRLGFGEDVGCKVEHPPERASFGADGYTLDDALRVGSERATVLGSDLLGFAPLVLLGFASLLVAPSFEALILAFWWVGLGLAYLLFYYGNAPVYGARHLFPVAPVVHVLVARMLPRLPRRPGPRLGEPHVLGGALLLILMVSYLTQYERWRRSWWLVKLHQENRPDVHRQAAQVKEAIVVSGDHFSVIEGMDPWRDRGVRRVGQDDRAGLIELRRAHPTWKVYAATPGGLLLLELPPLRPGLHVELEQAWPSRVWPSGLALKRVETEKAIQAPSSGQEALGVHAASPRGSAELVFDVIQPGLYRLRVEGIAGPFMGQYELAVDGTALPPWEGYAPSYRPLRGGESEPIRLEAGRHRLTMRSTGKAAESKGYLALFDTLEGSLVEGP
ncbi:MAG: hypothetical protein MUF64_14120 [Polyangiaceae bacterium]|nr:hypothetical protein [Polyangiaceae bacterium]